VAERRDLSESDAPTREDVDELRAADGRVPGRRGRATRQRLLDRTSALLATTAYRDLKVIDVAREAGTSPATFYQYFADVEAAVLVLADELAEERTRLAVPVREGDWSEQGALTAAAATVDAVLAFWEDHRALLRVLDLVADEGDERFRTRRADVLAGLTAALTDVASAALAARRLPATAEPRAHAVVLVAMLAQGAAHHDRLTTAGIRPLALRRALAHQLAWGVTGHLPAG
jgi:AcrR family transcriptional regulator